jgi:hypothetical protein
VPTGRAGTARTRLVCMCFTNMGTLSCPYGRAGGVGVRKLATIRSTRCVHAGVT